MSKTLGLVHTAAGLIPVFERLRSELLPGCESFNIVDDSLLKDALRHGSVTPQTARRVVDHVGSAAAAGADLVLVTCSSIGAAAEMAAELTAVPVLRVDQPMVDRAVRAGGRIGILATLATTLQPTADLVRRRAQALGQPIELDAHLCEGAFQCLQGGDTARHDELVREGLRNLQDRVECVLLAQASMARVLESTTDERPSTSVLASPRIAMEYLARVMADDVTFTSAFRRAPRQD